MKKELGKTYDPKAIHLHRSPSIERYLFYVVLFAEFLSKVFDVAVVDQVAFANILRPFWRVVLPYKPGFS